MIDYSEVAVRFLWFTRICIYIYTIYPTIYICRYYYRRKFRSQTSDNMDKWKAENGRGREKRKIRRTKSRRERVRRKQMQMREKVGKSRFTAFFKWFVAPEGRKVGSLKRRVRSQLARWEMKNCTPLWREAHLQVKMYKTHQVRTTFGSWDVKKMYTVVARSTFRSQNAQSTPGPDHFWQLRRRKSAPCCGAKHISKSKCTKHTPFGPLLEVEMSKKCTLLWREAHFEVKMFKNTRGSDHFWRFRCRKNARRCGAKHISKSKCSKHQGFGPLLEVQMSKKCTPLWREAHFEGKMFKTLGVRTTFGGSDVASLHYTTLHYTTLHCTTLQDITLHYTPVHYVTLHNTPVHSTTLNYTTPHYITLHYAPLQYTTLHHITLHYTPLHYITLYYTIFHYTKLHYTTLHYTTLRSSTLHYTTSHYTTLHSTALHYTILHYLPLHFTILHYTTFHYTTTTTTTTTTQLHSTTLHYTPLH